MLVRTGQAFQQNKLSEREFIGIVEDNEDPEQAGRVRVRVKELHGSQISKEMLPWATLDRGTGVGASETISGFSVPVIGSSVKIRLDKGDIYSPVYEGIPTAKTHVSDDMKQDYPNTYGFADELGNRFYVNKTSGETHVEHQSGTKITINNEGTVTVEVMKDHATHIKGKSDVVIDEASTVSIGSHSDVEIGNNSTLSVGGSSETEIGGSLSLSVQGSADISVTGATTVTTDSVELTTNGNVDATIGGSMIAQVTGNADVTTNGSVDVTASGGVNVLSPSEISLKSNSSVSVEAANVELVGTEINVQGGILNLAASSAEPLMLGNQFAAWLQTTLKVYLDTHTHTTTAPGSPTSPPLLPFQLGTAVPLGPIYSKTIKAL